jgi:formylglycine-generating enzyme
MRRGFVRALTIVALLALGSVSAVAQSPAETVGSAMPPATANASAFAATQASVEPTTTAGPSAQPFVPPPGMGSAVPSAPPLPSSSTWSPAVPETTTPSRHDDEGEEPPTPIPTASASVKAKPLRVVVPEKDGMLLLPGGEFTMGTADRKAASAEKPPHHAFVSAFWIDRNEVTVAAYRECVDKRACVKPAETSEACTFNMNDPELPINCVTFASATSVCRFRSKRLLREVEWEFAARGTHAIRFPWGLPTSSCALAATLRSGASGRPCTAGRPARVGSYAMGASLFGVHDLAGNVEEWVDDVFDGRGWAETPKASNFKELRPAAGANHILRGGSWLLPPLHSRTTARNWGSNAEAGPGVGVRCARDAAP